MNFSENPKEFARNWFGSELGIDQIESESTATFEDIKARIIYQHETYLQREMAGELTPGWRRYERRHGEEINAIRERLENEASF